MIKISATKLRQNLFKYLRQAAEGETIIIERNKKEVARLFSMKRSDWRDSMTIKPEILVTPEELLRPLDGLD